MPAPAFASSEHRADIRDQKPCRYLDRKHLVALAEFPTVRALVCGIVEIDAGITRYFGGMSGLSARGEIAWRCDGEDAGIEELARNE